MENIIEEITKLTNVWRSLGGKGHCKDRDFHWYIETKWSYGQPPKYSVQHHGYILHDFEEIECSSYEEALTVLRDTLKEKIEDERKFIEERNEEDGW
jgi:hypothetical protein